MTARNAQKIDALTALRGIAAWLVVLSHSFQLTSRAYFGEMTDGTTFLSWLDFGTFAVVLFFVLSGFTLYVRYGADRLSAANIGRFLVRRIFRIYPAFLASFALCLPLRHIVNESFGFPREPWIGDFAMVPDIGIILEYVTLTFNFSGHWSYVNGVYWSLPVEFQFYLLFPFMIALLRWHPMALIAGVGAAYVANHKFGFQFLTLQLAWQFAGGVLAAWLVTKWRAKTSLSLVYASVTSFVLAAAYVRFSGALPTLPGFRNQFMTGSTAFYYGLIAIGLVAAASRANADLWPRRIRSFLIRQGEISYSVYLFHTVFVLFGYALIVTFRPVGIIRLISIYAFIIVGTGLLASASYMLIERHGIALGRQLSDLIVRRRGIA